ncbi:hypothetical protein FQN55_000821 [Onygenales sp. PD_40]|nr:hypothetical protein FQN55_000821 [Onygenales sp. PD_40]KAK2777137.1 hypothetical protein FQN52_003224 [Onygenales sp. PD_12]KAK2802410.1 hypothetical protein FQN51_004473 [Onygenales sp. PD_10]
MAPAPEAVSNLLTSSVEGAHKGARLEDASIKTNAESSVPDANNDGLAFWSKHCSPMLSSLLRSVGSYTAEQQESHLKFLERYVIPNMGPPPDPALPRSLLTPNGAPFEASINFNNSGKACIRFTFEPLMPERGTLSDSPIPSIAEAVLADLRWFKQFAAEFFPSEEERQAIKEKMPPDTARIPRCFLAFDLDGGNISMKAYFSPMMKHMATGVDSDEATVNLLKRLEPLGKSFLPTLNYIEKYQPICQQPPLLQVAGIDCTDPGRRARVKVYTNPRSSSFDAVYEHVTFGGRRTDKATLEGLSVLREMWHLFTNEPDGHSDTSFSKPVLDPKDGHQGVCCSWELLPGQEIPEVKVYVALFQYFLGDRAISESLEKVFEKRGWSWGVQGTYKSLVEQACGSDIVSDDIKTPTAHTYVSFNFSEKRGLYLTTYLAPFVRFT